jgi:hypothetical protein
VAASHFHPRAPVLLAVAAAGIGGFYEFQGHVYAIAYGVGLGVFILSPEVIDRATRRTLKPRPAWRTPLPPSTYLAGVLGGLACAALFPLAWLGNPRNDREPSQPPFRQNGARPLEAAILSLLGLLVAVWAGVSWIRAVVRARRTSPPND